MAASELELSAVAGEQYAYLTTTGRRSGAPHRIEIWFAVDGGLVYVMAGGRESTDWVRNLLADPVVQLRIADREWSARARVVDAGSDEDARVRPLLRDKYADGDDDLVGWARTALPVAFEPT